MALALTWTRGRLLYTSPAHLKQLNERLMDLRDFARQIDDAMAAQLREARARCTPQDWVAALELIGLSALNQEILQFHSDRQPTPNRETKRASAASRCPTRSAGSGSCGR